MTVIADQSTGTDVPTSSIQDAIKAFAGKTLEALDAYGRHISVKLFAQAGDEIFLRGTITDEGTVFVWRAPSSRTYAQLCSDELLLDHPDIPALIVRAAAA